MSGVNKVLLLDYLKWCQKNKNKQLENINNNDWNDSEVVCELAVYGKIIHELEGGRFDLDLARSAPETTASPSETAADKGILTEEELNKIENSYGIYLPGLAERYPDVVNLIASHRNLFSANAELSFRNGKLQREVEYLRHNYELKEETK